MSSPSNNLQQPTPATSSGAPGAPSGGPPPTGALNQWAQIPASGQVYSARTGHVVISFQDPNRTDEVKFYVFGGTDGSARQADVHEFNTRTNEWHAVRAHGTPPAARSGAQAVLFEGKVWVFGGYTRKDGDYFNDVYVFHLPREGQHAKWECMTTQIAGEAPSKRTDHTTVLFGRSMWVFGGFDGRTRFNDLRELRLGVFPSGGVTESSSVPQSRHQSAWIQISTRTQRPRPRFGHSAVTYENSMYIFGGWDGHQTLQELQEYNFNTNAWQAVGTGGAGGGASVNPANLEQGGNPNNVRNSASTNGQQNNSAGPSARYRHSAIVLANSMYVFGGVDKDQKRFNDLYQFDFFQRRWSYVDVIGAVPRNPSEPELVGGNVPTARTFHRAAVNEISGKMYILGGFDGRRQNDLHVIQVVPHVSQRTPSVVGRARGVVAGTGSSSSSSAPPPPPANQQSGIFSGITNNLGFFNPGSRTNSTGSNAAGGGPQPLVSGSSGDLQGMASVDTTVDGGIVGDGSEAATALMPEDFWKWQAIEQHGKIYTPRTGHAVVVYGNKFYLMGGTDESARQNDIYCFDCETNNWTMLQNIKGNPPSARSGSKAIVYSDSIYFFGGYTKKDGEYFQDLYSFNLRSSFWQKIKAENEELRPHPRTDHTCCNYGPNIFVFGGFDGRSRFDDLRRFSIDYNRWEHIPQQQATPMARFGHSACMYGSSMYVFGGWNGHDTLDDLSEFSTTTGTWYHIPGRGNVPTSRYRHSAIVYGCCMFLFGGVDKQQNRYNDLYEFNFDSRNWSRINTSGEIARPTPRTFHKACIYGGRMYILGGFDGQRRNDMYRIAIIEERTEEEKKQQRGLAQQMRRLREDGQQGTSGEPNLFAGEEDDDEDMGTSLNGGTSANASFLESTPGGVATSAASSAGLASPTHAMRSELVSCKKQILELQKRLEREEERHICKICYEREINSVILDCNHCTACTRCVAQLDSCPICRTVMRKGWNEIFFQ
ncbi:unnamed protein product [Amoebophrya sp. A120]|nr:unnamed protein product [Amoebophrya sp. A120]|eukprot:GSA120T00004668001.1